MGSFAPATAATDAFRGLTWVVVVDSYLTASEFAANYDTELCNSASVAIVDGLTMPESAMTLCPVIAVASNDGTELSLNWDVCLPRWASSIAMYWISTRCQRCDSAAGGFVQRHVGAPCQLPSCALCRVCLSCASSVGCMFIMISVMPLLHKKCQQLGCILPVTSLTSVLCVLP
jgi:hypothetical protein